jgi:hypothetical protein
MSSGGALTGRASGGQATAQARGQERETVPPIAEVAVATLTLIVIGGVYLASELQNHISLALPIALLAAAGVLMVTNLIMLARVKRFAWRRFRVVVSWLLLAYVVIAGMLEYVFLYDGVHGGVLVVLTGMLIVFGLDVPLIISFTVARFADVAG